MKTGALIALLLIVVVVIGGIWYLGFQTTSENTNLNNGNTEGNLGNNNVENGGNVVDSIPKTYNINIQDFAYSPKDITIKVGDTVIWTNKDSVKHTVTSDSGNMIDSELLSQGQTYSQTFTQAGTYSYYCKPHPYMKGSVIVN